MKTIKCDRCGEDIPYIPPYINIAREGYIPPQISVTTWDGMSQTLNEVDLCDKCKKAVYNFIFEDKE